MIGSLILLLISTVVFYLWKHRRPKNYPPGPKPIPIFGNLFDMSFTGHFYEAVERWQQLYGPVVGLQILSDRLVVVTGVDRVLEALRKDEFQNRPDNFVLRERSFGKCLGIMFSSGEQWTASRKFTVKQLKAYGRNENEQVIAEEISRLMETIKDKSTIQGNKLFGLSAVNVIWTVVANKRIDLSDEESRQFLKNLFLFFRQGNPSGADIVNIFPILRHVSSKYQFSRKVIRETQDYIKRAIQEHKEVLDPQNPIDLIDHYLVEMEQRPNPYFTEENLIMIGVDLFGAGAESTSNSVEFILLYMVLYPEMQEKMQQELDRVLGRARKPVLNDKAELHYTMSVLSEVERLNSIAPTSPMHTCVEDTTFDGYAIPKGTLISLNLRSLGHDHRYWDHPEEFNPERFLNAEGKFTKSSILHSFGLGQRVCVGEMLARNTIFLFTATFFEKFSISLPAGEPIPSTVALPGFTTAPKPFKITIDSRY